MVNGDVEVGADEAKVTKAVEDLRKDWPELFGGEAPPPSPNGDPKGAPPKGRKTEDAYTKGMERAKAASVSTGYKLPGFETSQ